MRRSLANLNPDLVKKFPDFVCRVTADEGQIGRGHLGRFQEPEKSTPAILTTSQLLTTGIDVPTCKNVVIARVIGSMTEFKQIIGRGTRVRDDYGKFFFNIIDYTGSATEKFADPDFDGDPILVEEQQINESGQVAASNVVESEATKSTPTVAPSTSQIVDLPTERRKYYFDGGQVEIVAHMVHELDPDGKQLRVTRYTDYTADKVRTLFRHASEMRVAWAKSDQRTEIIKKLEERGISFEELARTTGNSEADPFDLLCNLAFKTPVKTRKNRADQLRRKHQDFFAGFRPEARQILDELVEKYAEHGVTQLVLPDVLQVPPISKHGNVAEIAEKFGGASKLKAAVADLEALLYA